MRLATRAAGDQFMATHYRRFGGQQVCPAPLPMVPNDYDKQLRILRRRLQLTQDGLARRIGAAGKAVIYQWESRKRTPSPVLWRRVLSAKLLRTGVGGEVKIVALNGDNDIATGLYDAELEIEAPRLLHGFVSRNNRPVAIEDNARPAPNSRSEAA